MYRTPRQCSRSSSVNHAHPHSSSDLWPADGLGPTRPRIRSPEDAVRVALDVLPALDQTDERARVGDCIALLVDGSGSVRSAVVHAQPTPDDWRPLSELILDAIVEYTTCPARWVIVCFQHRNTSATSDDTLCLSADEGVVVAEVASWMRTIGLDLLDVLVLDRWGWACLSDQHRYQQFL